MSPTFDDVVNEIAFLLFDNGCEIEAQNNEIWLRRGIEREKIDSK